MGSPNSVILGDNLVFTVCVHDPDTSAVTDADAVPTYRVYEDETGTAVLTGSMAKLDDANTTGFYSESIACTTANGFEVNKTYTIYVQGIVGGVTGAISYGLKCVASDTGPGDYRITLVVRTTDGTPIPGASVWVNTTTNRSGSAVRPGVTSDDGEVTFNLQYTTYYVYAHLAGYTFANTSITTSASETEFTLDIGTAVSVSDVDSSYDDSFLSRLIEDVREQVDEPTINAKYTDDRIIELAEKAYVHVIGEVNRNSKFPAVAKYIITIADGVSKYMLPHTIGSILAIYTETEEGNKLFYKSRSPHNPSGRNLWTEGNTLCIQPNGIGNGTEITVEYVPIGVARLHNGTCSVSADGLTVTLASTPHAGDLDTHAQAYAGSILRVLQVTGTGAVGNYMQERTITGYDNTTRGATVDVALNPVPVAGTGGYIYYEIAPAIHKGLDHVVSLYVGLHICNVEGNQKRGSGILKEFQSAMRNVRLTTYYSNIQEAYRWYGDNFDNSRYGGL